MFTLYIFIIELKNLQKQFLIFKKYLYIIKKEQKKNKKNERY